MKKTLLSAAALVLVAASMIALPASAQQDEAPLISNYGYTNLTYGYGQPDRQGTMKHREEVLVDCPEDASTGIGGSQTMHVMWVQEGGLEDGWKRLYEVWYRRSDDLGKTWSEPVCVADHCYGGVNETDKMMNVVGNDVYIVTRDQGTHLWLYRSKGASRTGDGKVAFEGKDLTPGEHNIDQFRSCVVGSQVAIAYYEYGASDTYYLYSADGENFTGDKVVADSTPYANQCFLKDFAFDGERMAMLYCHGDEVSMYVSDDFGRNWNATLLSPTFKDEEGKDYCKGGTFSWWRNGGAGHPVPQVAIDGNKLYTLFYTAMPDAAGLPSEDSYAVVARSLDGGKNWLPLTKITDEFDNHNGNLIVRGDNVYVTFNNNDYQKRGVYHSHDGGATFELQNSWGFTLGSQYNAYASDGELYVDSNDATGQTAYFLFNDYGYVKTVDGFRTVCEVHSNANRYTDERFTHLLVDREARRHWFVEHQTGEYGIRYINYRREGDDPQASWADHALHLAPTGNWDHMNCLTVHNTWETMPNREMTVEYWVKTGERTGMDIARVWCGGASGYEGWSTRLWYSESYGKNAFVVKLRNYNDRTAELVSGNVGYNTWCHVAFTYSESAREARLYVDGQLADTEPMDGSIRWGRLPIVIGGGHPDDDVTIDDFRLWNRPLTADEIAANYAAKAAGKSFTGASGLMLNYTFNRTLHDMSSHGHHAIPLGIIDFQAFDPTAIHGVMAPTAVDGRTYDLQGRPEAGSRSSVVIKDGRKQIVK